MKFDAAKLMQELLNPAEKRMSPELARFFVEWEFSREAVERMRELSDKANDGRLTTEEAAELDAFISIGDRLATLKLQAEDFLERAGSAA